MNNNTKRLSRLAIFTALGVAFLFFGSVLPSARLAIAALAGFFAAAALMMYGWGWAIGVYAVTAALALLILPSKICAILYAAFFGFYPLLKALFEKHIRNPSGCWAAKFAAYTLVFFLGWFFASALFMPEGAALGRWYILWPLGAVAFAAYDLCFSFLVKLYIERISGYFQ